MSVTPTFILTSVFLNCQNCNQALHLPCLVNFKPQFTIPSIESTSRSSFLPPMETTLSWHHNPLSNPHHHLRYAGARLPRRPAQLHVARAFQRSDFDSFARSVSAGEGWKDAWRTANEKFEYFVYEARKTAERIDREYKVSVKVNSAVRAVQDKAREIDREYKVSVKVNSAVRAVQDKAREIDREYEIGQKWRGFALDFSRNWPRYRRELSDVVGSPLGRSVAGECPACKRQFIGSRLQIVQCGGCGNIVRQPTGDPFPRNSGGSSSSKSKQYVIDVEFEER